MRPQRETAGSSSQFEGILTFCRCLLCTEGKKMKILVVEAEEATLKATSIMLNKLGYEVALAANC